MTKPDRCILALTALAAAIAAVFLAALTVAWPGRFPAASPLAGPAAAQGVDQGADQGDERGTDQGTEPQAGGQVPGSAAEMTLSFAAVVKRAAPAVVNIYATQVVPQSVSPFADDPFFSQFFGDAVVPRRQNSLGSGVILRGDGIVVSNYHVVGEASEIRVVLSDRREFEGRVILSDARADLAVIRLAGASGLPALGLADSDRAEVGDLVLAIGNPFGVGQTVTSGIVSGLARSGIGPGAGPGIGRTGGYFIQTDAAINPGNSGGALVDMDGRLLGINTSILTRSGGSQGVGFAIPSNLVRQNVEQAEAGATALVRPWPGIETQAVDAGMAEALGMAAPRGVMILRAHPDSPFLAAGLGEGDVILSLGGFAVDAPGELDFRLATLGVGGTARAEYWRDGVVKVADVALSAAPGGDVREVAVGEGTGFEGLSVAPLTPALAERLGLPLSAEGVVVTSVGGRAAQSQLQPGDVVTRVNGTVIGTPEELDRALRAGGRRWQIEFDRGGQHATIRLRG
ncbi:MAG: trypsin-like peptidase domain-containing protein [Paracoccaceae bacterium]